MPPQSGQIPFYSILHADIELMKKRVVIFVSGYGSNMKALVEAAAGPDFPAEIVGVISNRTDAKGLASASSMGIETKAIIRAEYASNADMDKAIDAELVRMKADIVCLAGYMRLLTRKLTEKWAGRIINIHPSLLPLFPGLESHARALEAGMRIHGCSVHFVTAGMDEGPIIAQAAVPVLPEDDVDTLAARVLKAEHKLYPQALKLVATGKARMHNGRALLSSVHAQGMLLSVNSENDAIDIENLARMTP